jgi:hypothetical protein
MGAYAEPRGFVQARVRGVLKIIMAGTAAIR